MTTVKYQNICPFVKRDGRVCGSRCMHPLCSKHLKSKSARSYLTTDQVDALSDKLQHCVVESDVEPETKPLRKTKRVEQIQQELDDPDGPTDYAQPVARIPKPRGRPPKATTVSEVPKQPPKSSRVSKPEQEQSEYQNDLDDI